MLATEHILLTIPTFSVAIKLLLYVITINWKSDLLVNLHWMFLFLWVEGVENVNSSTSYNKKETNSYTVQWSIILLVTSIEKSKQQKDMCK